MKLEGLVGVIEGGHRGVRCAMVQEGEKPGSSLFSRKSNREDQGVLFFREKAAMEETVSEILPGSISNKHRICSQAHAPLGALCVSSSCTCTHYAHEVCSISGHTARHQSSHLEVL